MKKRVADIAIETLVNRGITDCFAVVGGGAMHLDNALALNSGMNKVFNHHEQACAMAAEAYARVSGKMAMVCVTSGPGATNTITGVMGAYQDSIPMIVISGNVRYGTMVASTDLKLRYRGVQELNVIPIVQSITKYAVMITDPLEIQREISRAIDIALEGRRGPVWVDIPLDMQSAIVETSELYTCEEERAVPGITNEETQEILEIISKAERPCVLGGTGIVSSDTKKQFIQFVEELNIPVVGGGWCTDMMGTSHRLYFGLSGDIGPRTGNFILQNADVILVLGNSLSFRQTGFAQEKFAPNAKILYVDIDSEEEKKPGLHIYKFYHSDLNKFFETMKLHVMKPLLKEEWMKYCNNLKKRFSPFESIQNIDAGARVNSYYFWKIFDKMIDADQIIAMGNSRVNAAKIQIGVETQEQRAITNYLCGSMGYDLPAAIGCAVATGKDIICVTGDGSIMMNLQELETMHHNHMPIKVVVFSNDGYEAIRQTHKNFFKGSYVGCTPESGIGFPNFRKVAESVEFEYMVCERNADVQTSLKRFLDSDKPVLMEVLQQIDNPLIPKVMSRMKDDGTFETPALHDMAPFLPEEELKQLMLWEDSDDE